jgi:hypothetical protein
MVREDFDRVGDIEGYPRAQSVHSPLKEGSIYQTRLYTSVCMNIITIAPIPQLPFSVLMFIAVKAIQSPKVMTIPMFDVKNIGRRPRRSTMKAANIASNQFVVA